MLESAAVRRGVSLSLVQVISLKRPLLPALRKAQADIRVVVTSQGSSAAVAAKRFSIPEAASDVDALFVREDIDAVMITTPHNTHARMVNAALDTGKHVFVEKPLCMSLEELDEISAKVAEAKQGAPILMVGFNRRFAPMVVQMKQALRNRNAPLFGVINCNAGAIPPDHWTQDPERGGGRIIGEACHFIDLARYFTGAPISRVSAMKTEPQGVDTRDTFAISLGFVDGSVIQVNYFASGSKAMPKETVMLSWDGKSLEMNNFLKLKGYGAKTSAKSWSQDKGHFAECVAFMNAVKNGLTSPIPYDEIENVMRATFLAVEAAEESSVRNLEI